MRCRREIIYYYYVVPFPPPRPTFQYLKNTRARKYLTNNLIFLLQIGTNQTDSVFEHRESRQRVRPDTTTF